MRTEWSDAVEELGPIAPAPVWIAAAAVNSAAALANLALDPTLPWALPVIAATTAAAMAAGRRGPPS